VKSIILICVFSIFIFNSAISQIKKPFNPNEKPPNTSLKTTGIYFTGIGIVFMIGGALLVTDATSPSTPYPRNFKEFLIGAPMIINGAIGTLGGLIMTGIGQRLINKEMKKRLSFQVSPVSAGFIYQF
jgi:hypothetical protein